MNRRRVLLIAVVALATPLVTACGDDDDDGPADPTVTLFEGTANPNVSTDTSG